MRPTLPAVVADAQLLAGEVAVAAVGTATVVAAVGDVAGLALPVLVALAVHAAGDGVARGALAVARAVVGARVDAGQAGKHTRSAYCGHCYINALHFHLEFTSVVSVGSMYFSDVRIQVYFLMSA